MDSLLFYYKKCLKNYANFKGRARRKEYWLFVLANTIIGIILSIIDSIIGIPNLGSGGVSIIVSITSLYSLIVFVPAIAVGVRRLHDIGKSGWFYLLILIPLIGAIILIVWCAKPGNLGINEYGADPKEITETE